MAEGRLRVAPSDGGHLVHHHGGVATQPVARVGADEDPEQGRLHGCISGTTSTPTTRHSCGPGCCRRCCTTTCGPISRGPGDNCCGPTACCPGPRRRSRLRCRSSLLTTSRPACVECGGWRVAGAGLVRGSRLIPRPIEWTEIVESLGAQATISVHSTWGVRVQISGRAARRRPLRSPPAPRCRSGPG